MIIKKFYIGLISTVVVLGMFALFLFLFKGVTDYVVHQIRPTHIVPSPKDSLYMKLLQDENKRPLAMEISRTVQPFFFIADSTATILEAKISPEYISDIIINKGLAQEIRQSLLRLDTSSVVPCGVCMDTLVKNNEKWLSFFQHSPPLQIQSYLKTKISCIDSLEQKALIFNR